MTTHDIDALIARLKGVGCNVPIADEAADALQQQAERITAQDVKCRLYEAALDKADREIEGLKGDLADQQDKHGCALRLLKCDDEFIARQTAALSKSTETK